MLIAVAHKWAPDPADAVVAADGAVDFSRAHPGLGAYDAVAIAVARGLADAVGGELVGLSAGPEATLAPQARKAVLARGLDRLLLAAVPGDAEASLTAAALVGLVRHAGEVDVVVAGDASVDAGAGLVPALLAGRLGWLCLLEVTAVRPGPVAGELVVLRRGVDAVKQEPGAAREVYFRVAGVEPGDALTGAIYDATVPCFTHDFSMSDDYYARLEAWMKGRGLIDATPGGDAYWTNSLAL